MARESTTLKAMRMKAAGRKPPRLARRVLSLFFVLQVLLALALVLALPAPVRAAPAVKAEAAVTTTGGYARLVFTFSEETEADIRLANGIVVISFKKPVEISVDNLSTRAPGYISAARRDPDGSAVRMALARKVTINSMTAGERLFVDLLPDKWTGVAPGLPQDVIEELARRAREAEKKAREAQRVTQRKQFPPVRVRVGTLPTFTRYVFELPELIAAATDRSKDKLTVTFDAPLKFDLSDALGAMPATISAITADAAENSSSVSFRLAGKSDLRTFREDNNFVVDVGVADSKPQEAQGPGPLKSGELPSLVVVPPEPKTKAAEPEPKPVPSPAKPDRAAETPTTPPPVAQARAPREPDPTPGPAEDAAVGFPPVMPWEGADQKNAGPAKPPAPRPAEPSPPMAPAATAAEQSAPVTPEKPARAAAEVQQEAKSSPPEPAPAPARPGDASAPVKVGVVRKGDALQLVFPFAAPTPAAVFRRFDTLWLVFDTGAPIDVAPLIGDLSRTIRGAEVMRSGEGQVVRIQLERPRLTSAGVEGLSWTVTLGDVVLAPTAPLSITRLVVGPGRANSVIPFEEPRKLHRLSDPEIGDSLLVVTALGPARGFLKTQDFVEFRALASVHGVAIQPLADDLTAAIVSDKIIIERPNGLVLSAVPWKSAAPAQSQPSSAYRPALFDVAAWDAARGTKFTAHHAELMRAAAAAPEARRSLARFDLARFYIRRELFPEARAVLDVAVAEDRPTTEDPTGLMLRAVANVMMKRGGEALKDLASPVVGNDSDAVLWRGLALAQQGKWVEARADFKAAEATLRTLPAELQRFVLTASAQAAIEVNDFAEASRLLQDLETVGVPPDMKASVAVLAGRVSEGLGRISDALADYRKAADANDRRAAAQGRLRETLLRFTLKEMDRKNAIAALETLSTTWRGDDTEIEALQLLGRLYTQEGRYRDAFYVMRTALSVRPNSAMTRRIQDEAAVTFDSLFLTGKGDALPAIEALSLFYDFRQLMPLGRRGDEMIRRLADRLVSVDLLDQAAELLQHQVDHRLQGAARAQVAARLAVVYLLAHKPDHALEALRASRSGDLNNDLRHQRLLLEARALSETGRPDVALEVVANLEGREADRMRADVLWRGRRWREAAEQIEKLYGERWRDFAPLSDAERPDILRAAVGFALAQDELGLGRFREKYAAKMADSPDANAFKLATAPHVGSPAEFREIAKAAIGADTLDQFLRDMRARYPESAAATADEPRAAPDTSNRPPPGSSSAIDPLTITGQTTAR